MNRIRQIVFVLTHFRALAVTARIAWKRDRSPGSLLTLLKTWLTPWLTATCPTQHSLRRQIFPRIPPLRERSFRLLQDTSSFGFASTIFVAGVFSLLFICLVSSHAIDTKHQLTGARSVDPPSSLPTAQPRNARGSAAPFNNTDFKGPRIEARVNHDQNAPDTMGEGSQEHVSSLLAVVDILASLFGIVIAAAIFGVQFHGDRLGYSAFLVPFFAARQGIMQFAALALALSAANVVVAFLLAPMRPAMAQAMIWIDAVLLSLLLPGIIWVLVENIRSVGAEGIHEFAIPSTTYDQEQSITLSFCLKARQIALDRAIEAAGAKAGPADNPFVFGEDSTTIVFSAVDVAIVDVNLPRLVEFIATLNDRFQGKQVHVTIVLGRTCGASASVKVWDGRTNTRIGFAPSTHAELTQELAMCVILQHEKACTFDLTCAKLLDAARWTALSGNSLHLNAILAVLSDLVRRDALTPHRIDVPTIGPICRCRSITIDHYIGEIAHNAWQSRDDQSVAHVLDWAGELMTIGQSTAQYEVFETGAWVVEFLWSKSLSKQPSNSSRFLTQVDRLAYRILSSSQFSESQVSQMDDESSVRTKAGFHHELGWVMRLAKIALENSATSDCEWILDRMFAAAPPPDGREMLSSDSLPLHDSRPHHRALTNYAAILIAGWGSKQIIDHPSKRLHLGAVLARIAREFRTSVEVLETLAAVRKSYNDLAKLDCLLAANHWEPSNVDARIGRVRPFSTSNSWRSLGIVSICGCIELGRVFPQNESFDAILANASEFSVHTMRTQVEQLLPFAKKGLKVAGFTRAKAEKFLNSLEACASTAKERGIRQLMATPESEYLTVEAANTLERHLGRNEGFIALLRREFSNDDRGTSCKVQFTQQMYLRELVVKDAQSSWEASRRAEQAEQSMMQWFVAEIGSCAGDRAIIAESPDDVRAAIDAAALDLIRQGRVPTVVGASDSELLERVYGTTSPDECKLKWGFSVMRAGVHVVGLHSAMAHDLVFLIADAKSMFHRDLHGEFPVRVQIAPRPVNDTERNAIGELLEAGDLDGIGPWGPNVDVDVTVVLALSRNVEWPKSVRCFKLQEVEADDSTEDDVGSEA